MPKPHYAWLVCAGCALLMFCTSGLAINAFTVYQPHLIEHLSLTNTQSSAIVTVRALSSFLSMFLTNAYYRLFGLRVGMSAACALTALGFALFGFADSFGSCCVAAGVLGLGYGLGTMIPIAIVLERWFASGLTLAIGICSAVTGLSTLGIPSLLTWGIESVGLSVTFWGEAIFVALCALIVLALIRSNPAQLSLEPHHARCAKRPRTNSAFTYPVRPYPALRTRHWVLIAAMLLLQGGMTIAGYSHLSVLVSSEGYGPHVTALAITASGVALTIGKVVFGWSTERWGTYRCNGAFGAVLITGLALLCAMGASGVVLAFATIIFGFGLSLTTVGLTAWAKDLSSEDTYESAVRRFQIGCAAGGLVFSPLPGILADACSGSYVPAYGVFLICAVVVIGVMQWLYRRK